MGVGETRGRFLFSRALAGCVYLSLAQAETVRGEAVCLGQTPKHTLGQ